LRLSLSVIGGKYTIDLRIDGRDRAGAALGDLMKQRILILLGTLLVILILCGSIGIVAHVGVRNPSTSRVSSAVSKAEQSLEESSAGGYVDVVHAHLFAYTLAFETEVRFFLAKPLILRLIIYQDNLNVAKQSCQQLYFALGRTIEGSGIARACRDVELR
jgi:hypothetical protein